MTEDMRIDGDRLWSRLMEMAKIGATANGGVCRLALTDLDRQARDLFCQWAREAGCTIQVDAMGNIFARRSGIGGLEPAVAAGSHLDTQPSGGKFDGVLGVLASLEVIDTLNDHGVQTSAPVEAVVWTNEEGARFGPAMIGSGVYAGTFDLDYAYARKDRDGVTLGDELARIGYVGDLDPGAHKLAAHFELHIEQGPILERNATEVGVVTGVNGIMWYDLTIQGFETHAGPTPMSMRRDPVPVAAEVIPHIYAIAASAGEDARCTIGVVKAEPGSPNTVPGKVCLTVDFRHPAANVLEHMHQALNALVTRHGGGPCPISLTRTWYSPPVDFADSCIRAVAEAAELCGSTSQPIASGAGHDSVYLSGVAPTGMIFIPCKDGLSHNELEYTSPQQATMGANVLLHAVLSTAGIA